MDITERIGMNLAICRHLGKLCDWWGGKAKLLDLYAGAVSEGDPFNTIFTVNRLKSPNIPKDTTVMISTIQRLFSLLSGVVKKTEIKFVLNLLVFIKCNLIPSFISIVFI